MMAIEIIHFALKYTPFWAIPLLMICIQFAYIYWSKKYRFTSKSFITIGVLSFFSIIYYIWAGGGEPAVQYFLDFCALLSEDV